MHISMMLNREQSVSTVDLNLLTTFSSHNIGTMSKNYVQLERVDLAASIYTQSYLLGVHSIVCMNLQRPAAVCACFVGWVGQLLSACLECERLVEGYPHTLQARIFISSLFSPRILQERLVKEKRPPPISFLDLLGGPPSEYKMLVQPRKG